MAEPTKHRLHLLDATVENLTGFPKIVPS